MDINKLNYELYFVDFYEDRLSTEQVAELMVFLEQHADLKAEFEDYSELESIAHDIEFKEKGAFKKIVVPTLSINESNAEEFLIANIEGDLSSNEQKELNSFLSSNPIYKSDQKLFNKSKLSGASFVFKNKESLKKSVVVPLWIKRTSQIAAAAAIVLFAVGIFRTDNIAYTPRPATAEANTINDPAKGVQLEYDLFEKPNVAATHNTASPKRTLSIEYLLAAGNDSELNIQVVNSPKEKIVAFLASKSDDNDKAEVPTEGSILEEVVADVSTITVEHFKTGGADRDHVSIKQGITNFLKKRVLKKDVGIIKSHILDLELAHTIVQSVNKIFGTSVNLKPTYNDEGDMIAYALESNSFELQRSVKE